MGGAGTAAAFDYSAAYYNPANLSFCPTSSLSASFSRANMNLSVDSDNESVTTDAAGVRTGIDLGICTHGPYNLTFGFMFGTGLEAPQRFGQNSVDALPRFVLYGPKMDQLSIQLGMAYRIIESLSIGVGAAVLINSDLALTNRIPVLVEGEEIENVISWNLEPRMAPYIGVSYEPIPDVHVGLSYRGALYHQLNAVAFTEVNAVGIDLQIDLLLESVAWYSPQQAAFGASFAPMPGLIFAGDVTWYNWSNDPGPFIRASPYQGSPVAESLDFPEPYEPNYRDIVQPRFGVEYTWREMIDFRGGYSLRPWIAPVPDGLTNLLDSTTHILTLGGGYRWGARVSEDDGDDTNGDDAVLGPEEPSDPPEPH